MLHFSILLVLLNIHSMLLEQGNQPSLTACANRIRKDAEHRNRGSGTCLCPPRARVQAHTLQLPALAIAPVVPLDQLCGLLLLAGAQRCRFRLRRGLRAAAILAVGLLLDLGARHVSAGATLVGYNEGGDAGGFNGGRRRSIPVADLLLGTLAEWERRCRDPSRPCLNTALASPPWLSLSLSLHIAIT